MEGMYVERNDIIQTDFDDSTSSTPILLQAFGDYAANSEVVDILKSR